MMLPGFNIPGMAGLGARKAPNPKDRYATFNRRMLAATIDSVLIMILVAPLMDDIFTALYGPVQIDVLALWREASMKGDPLFFQQRLIESGFLMRWLANCVWQTVILAAATALFWHRWSATPGKMMLGIKIVDAETEANITGRQIWLRLLGYVLSFAVLLIGFLWIGIDRRCQAWHDKIAGTVVIRIPKPGSPVAGRSGSPAP